eukprot:m.21427 g.21427  ORF g.21427 m.21427 type:complete len:364 (-) comp12693_c0_seq1:136-1227(-)
MDPALEAALLASLESYDQEQGNSAVSTSRLSEEDQLRIALEASIHQMGSTDLILGDEKLHKRTEMANPIGSFHGPDVPLEGDIHHINTFNQFHAVFHAAIAEYSAPKSICGATSLATATLLSQHPTVIQLAQRGGEANLKDIETLKRYLSSKEVFFQPVRNALKHMFDSRTRYISTHQPAFKDRRDRKQYLSAWAANYELSDFLKDFHNRMLDEGLSANKDFVPVHFFRFNQWPDHDIATYEERERLEQEKHFGGAKNSSGDACYKDGDAAFWVETWQAGGDGKLERLMRSPEQWTKDRLASDKKAPTLFVLDTAGHFVAGLSVLVEGKRRVVIFNTTDGSYAASAVWPFDLCFPPPPKETAE